MSIVIKRECPEHSIQSVTAHAITAVSRRSTRALPTQTALVEAKVGWLNGIGGHIRGN
jgi:hypothetical protein